MKQKFQFQTFSMFMQSIIACATCALANCASNTQVVPISTAWKNVDLSETSLRKATKQLQNSLLAAAKDMNITNCGDLGSSALRQSFLTSLQSMKSVNPPMASAALISKTRVLGSIQDLRRDAGALQVGMNQLVAAFERGEQNPTEREDLTKSMSRIKVEAEGAVGFINYAEQIADQLQRLGG